MINIAICDDEEIFAEEVEKYLRALKEKYKEQVTIFRFTNPIELLKLAENVCINYVFLDIEMPEKNGFDVAKELIFINEDLRVFFVSGYSEYVFKSFAYNPPMFVRKERLKEDMEYSVRLLDKWIAESMCVYEFPMAHGKQEIYLQEVFYIVSEKNYLIFTMKKKGLEYKVRMTVKQFVKEVDNPMFYRVNSGCIINMNYVRNIENRNVVMDNGVRFGIGRLIYSEFRKNYMNFLFKDRELR